jgi:hypothetical protein
MDSRRFLKPAVAAILAAGLLTLGVAAPADAGGTKGQAPTHSTNDTGWGIR